MAQQAEHDEIGIEAVQTVSGIGVAAMSAFLARRQQSCKQLTSQAEPW